MNKKVYEEWVLIPKNPKETIRVFENPILEFLSKTPWYALALFWTPVILYLCYRSLELGFFTFLALYIAGFLFWTLTEYVVHRLLFHGEKDLPDNKF